MVGDGGLGVGGRNWRRRDEVERARDRERAKDREKGGPLRLLFVFSFFSKKRMQAREDALKRSSRASPFRMRAKQFGPKGPVLKRAKNFKP